MTMMTKGVDSGDYRWHDEYAVGGALTDVPRQYDTRTPSQRNDMRIASLERQLRDLAAIVARLAGDDGK